MNDAQKRQYVSDLYPGPKWKKQVKNMPMDQIVAIYSKSQRDGIKPVPKKRQPRYTQLRIDLYPKPPKNED